MSGFNWRDLSSFISHYKWKWNGGEKKKLLRNWLDSIEPSHRIYRSARDVFIRTWAVHTFRMLHKYPHLPASSLLYMWTILAIKDNIPVVFKWAVLGDMRETLWKPLCLNQCVIQTSYLSEGAPQKSFWIPFTSAPLSNSSTEGVHPLTNLCKRRRKRPLWIKLFIRTWIGCVCVHLTCKEHSCCPETHPASCLCQTLWFPLPQTHYSPAEPGTHTPLCPWTRRHLKVKPSKAAICERPLVYKWKEGAMMRQLGWNRTLVRYLAHEMI